jgi:putative Holliday junction resolvase
MGRIMAFDFGTKRTGIAVSDEKQAFAFPLRTEPTQNVMNFIAGYIKENDVSLFVVGEPKRMDNTETHATKHVEQFIRQLRKKFGQIGVERVDERFTSSLAFQAMIDSGVKKSERRSKELLDTTSATIILQSYIASKESGERNKEI